MDGSRKTVLASCDTVLPSGFANAAICPSLNVPPAPALFSITIERPRCFSVAVASARTATSVVPPGAQGTIKVTGLDGKACAFAKRVAAGSTAAPAARRRKARRRSVMAFAPWNAEIFQRRALLRLRREGFSYRRLEMLPADGTPLPRQ